MKNINSKLFEKSFDLKKICGGISSSTYKECSTATSRSACGDTRTTTTTDHGKVLSDSTVDHNCPPI